VVQNTERMEAQLRLTANRVDCAGDESGATRAVYSREAGGETNKEQSD